ncbi:MAG: hypothetical protein V2I43_27060 [Parvularcula sp.]|nr:hypothetical protein [Parvularcula sp.]
MDAHLLKLTAGKISVPKEVAADLLKWTGQLWTPKRHLAIEHVVCREIAKGGLLRRICRENLPDENDFESGADPYASFRRDNRDQKSGTRDPAQPDLPQN